MDIRSRFLVKRLRYVETARIAFVSLRILVQSTVNLVLCPHMTTITKSERVNILAEIGTLHLMRPLEVMK